MTSRYGNHVYTLPPKFAYVIIFFGSGSIFLRFPHPWQVFWEVFWQFRATVQADATIQNDDLCENNGPLLHLLLLIIFIYFKLLFSLSSFWSVLFTVVFCCCLFKLYVHILYFVCSWFKQKNYNNKIKKFIHFVSQHKALYIDPCTLSSQILVVFLLICGSNITSIKLSRWHLKYTWISIC